MPPRFILGKSALFAALVLSSVSIPSPCAAEPRDPAAAEALFRAGRQAAERGDAHTACKRFEESLRLDAAAGTVLNLAECEQTLGHLARAWAHYNHLLDVLDPKDERLPEVRKRLAELEKRVPRLSVNLRAGSDANAEVQRDGVLVTPASLGLPIPLDPGRHELTVLLRGHRPMRYAVTLKEGEVRNIIVRTGPRMPAPAPLAVSPEPRARNNDLARTAGMISIGAAGAALIAAGFFGLRYLDARSEVEDHCSTPNDCDERGLRAAGRAEVFQLATLVSGVAAGVAVGTSVVLLSVYPAEPGPRSAPATGMSGVSWRTRF
ncbi:MAG TPA: hypothetical protein VK524_01490 [Polyangiaceae bacterium]|nr:hypothetical protein [Polyangiaceae bacterium]